MSLHMLCLPLDARQLARCSREHRLLDDRWSVDLGYQVHALLARLLGDFAPKPFDVQPGPRAPHVLAYSTLTLDAFSAACRQKEDASALAAVIWDRAGGKPVPSFAAGQRLGFRLRACPTVRVGRTHPMFKHGAEVDPFLVYRERLAAGEVPLAREDIYREWLRARLCGAACIESARLASLRDARLWRRGVPREGDTMHGIPRRDRLQHGRSPIGRREAVFEGTLAVNDPTAFAALLARGVGRHRAFGFGMLLLRPAD